MFRQNLHQAFQSIRANRLRAIITVLIIALGLTALIGVLTSIDGIKYSMRESFSTLGANTFLIENRSSQVRAGSGRVRSKPNPEITFRQAKAYKAMQDRYTVSLKQRVSGQARARFRSKTTHNNLTLKASDENFLQTEAYQIHAGRPLSTPDVDEGRRVILLGWHIKQELFPFTQAVGKQVFVGKEPFRVVGVLKERGTTFGSRGDKVLIIPITTARQVYGLDGSVQIASIVEQAENLPPAMTTSQGLFRRVRDLKPGEPDNFALVVAGSFVENLMDNLAVLTISATVIAGITLFGAAIGLMNIMLVSVTERTREIGVRKALGASQKLIQRQFLTEAITITQLGALLGILLGVLIGNLVGSFLNAPFVMPWGWSLLAIGLAFVVGLVSGWYPARKAARLDPIEALRHE